MINKSIIDYFFEKQEEVTNKKENIKVSAILFSGFFINSFIFQYLLWRFIQRDVPWYIDILAGLTLSSPKTSRIMWLIFVGTLVASYCGIDYPFFILPLEKQ